jgi:hypothetical protein
VSRPPAPPETAPPFRVAPLPRAKVSLPLPPFRLIFALAGQVLSTLLTVIFPSALPALMVSEPEGLSKTRVSKEPLPLRSCDLPFPATPSSSRMVWLSPEGRL